VPTWLSLVGMDEPTGSARESPDVCLRLLDLYGQFHDRRGTRSRLASSYQRRRQSFNFGVFALRPSSLEPTTFLSLCRLSREWFAHAAYPEQSIANLFFSSGWERLPRRLNYNPAQPNRFHIRLPVPFKPRQAGELIYHFYGPDKPWHRGHPFRKMWLRNLRLAEGISDFSRADPRARHRNRNELEQVILELAIRFGFLSLRSRHLIGSTLRRILS
jgi:lipopolysaccharide biosynthesis glycosyltransferase